MHNGQINHENWWNDHFEDEIKFDKPNQKKKKSTKMKTTKNNKHHKCKLVLFSLIDI